MIERRINSGDGRKRTASEIEIYFNGEVERFSDLPPEDRSRSSMPGG